MSIPLTRKEAIKVGSPFYIGKPCKSGHLKKRRVENSTCTQCEYERCKRRNKKIDKHSTKKQKLRRYGLSIEQFDAMLVAQDNKCELCRIEFTYENNFDRPYIDHDHVTNKVRSLLCSKCNSGLGFLLDSPELLLKASNYITYHKSKS